MNLKDNDINTNKKKESDSMSIKYEDSEYEYKTIILRSTHPEEYGDLEIRCKVIPNEKIAEYVAGIPEERKVVAYKNKTVTARVGVEGEIIETILKTTIDGKEYILSEEKNTVKIRDGKADIVVTNIHSTSDEEYIVKQAKFADTYDFVPDKIYQRSGFSPRYMPKPEPRVLSQVDENVVIMTSWGEPAVCLKGSYIVTYNADANDFNTIEQGAFDSTYKVDDSQTKRL